MPSTLRSIQVCGLLSGILGILVSAPLAHAQETPTPPATPATQATPAAPATQTPATPAPPPGLAFNFLLDGYYDYNFNRPKVVKGNSTPGINGPVVSAALGRNFDSQHNAFALGLAELGVSKATTATSRLGFTAKIAYGPTATAVISASDANNVNILQAYGTFLVPLKGKDLTVDAGKFVTHMGQEVIEPELNWNYSRSDLFQYFIPYYHSGIRAALPFGSKFTATGYVYNGWNNAVTDSNSSKSYGFALNFTPSPKYSLLLNGLASQEPVGYGGPPDPVTQAQAALVAGANDKSKNVLEPILTYNFSPALTGVIDGNFDFGKGAYLPGDPNRASSSWSSSGVAGYLHYAFPSGSALTARGEYYSDKKGALLGAANGKGGEFTLTYGLKTPLFVGAETRFEYRYDTAKMPGLFEDSSGSFATKKSQNTVSVSENLSF